MQHCVTCLTKALIMTNACKISFKMTGNAVLVFIPTDNNDIRSHKIVFFNFI